jgi:predicted alpha/beta hydrolase family esterase
MTTLLYVHGGTTHSSQEKYQDWLKNKSIYLEDVEWWSGSFLKYNVSIPVVAPRFPLKENAQYVDWKLFFERYLEKIDDELVLVGWSLGAIFLVKYLSENNPSRPIRATFLVAPPFDDSVEGEELCNGFLLSRDLSVVLKNSPHVHFYFSKDDFCVPFSHMEKYQKALPHARYSIFSDRNHFLQTEFPELIEHISEVLEE